MTPIRLDGKVVIVTGATGAWGSGACKALAARGATVVATSRTAANVELVAARLVEMGARALGVPQDVSTFEGAQHVVDRTVEELGRVDALVSCVGASPTAVTSTIAEADAADPLAFWGGSLLDITPEHWDLVIRTELTAVFTCTKAVAAQMVRQGEGGSIIHLGGGGGMYGMPGAGAHAAAKGGLASALWSWSDELVPHGIRVNALRGYVRSAMSDPSWSLADDDAAGAQERGFQSASAAPLIVWLASDDSADVTGHYLGIDGARATIWEPKPPDTAVFCFPGWTPEDLARTLGPILRRRPARPRIDALISELADLTDFATDLATDPEDAPSA